MLTGADSFIIDQSAFFSGRIGFIGNHTSRLVSGIPTHVAINRNTRLNIVRLFSPEHGAFGIVDDENVPNQLDPSTGLEIISLYGANRSPIPEMLVGLDGLIFDIQDVGARFYTYASTMINCLQAAHHVGIQFIVLDRPNPINGVKFEGAIADQLSFTACHSIPIRHGLTLGELAKLVALERGYTSSLTVVPCSGWQRDQWWDETDLAWVKPSPAMLTLDTAIVYPGVCLLEQTNISVGRGTEQPFQIVGAPWIDPERLTKTMLQTEIHGITIEAISFTPTSSKHAGQLCHGLRISITDRNQLNSVTLGFALIIALRNFYSDEFEIAGIKTLLANQKCYELLQSGYLLAEINQTCEESLLGWQQRIEPILIY